MNQGRIPEVGEPLSPRELEVLKHLKNGLSQKQVALLLGITKDTIRNHVCYILIKSGSPNMVNAVHKLTKVGII